MLKEEQIKEVVESYNKLFEESGITEGIIYDANIEVPSERTNAPDGKELATGAVFGIQRFKFAQYPHIECKLINANMQEIMTVVFMTEETSGEPIAEYKVENFRNQVFFNLDKIDAFVKDIKLGKIKVKLYLNEKARLEQQLAELNKIIAEGGIEEK